MMYDKLKIFLRVQRLSFELMNEINSEDNLKDLASDYRTGQSDQQKAIVNAIIQLEDELKTPNISNINKGIRKLQKLGCNIPNSFYKMIPINSN